jgi:hypothetical protein
MRKNINIIPLNNDINKLQAFIPSLNREWRDSQRIKSKPVMIETIDAVKYFQNEGWNIAGAYEQRSKNRKIDSHFIRMEHPDFNIKNNKGKVDAVATMNLRNSCNGNKPLDADLGVFRQVCSNGLWANTSYSNQTISHSNSGYSELYNILGKLNICTQSILDEFNTLKQRELTPNEMMQLSIKAAELRFDDKREVKHYANQLLNVVRDEDQGNDLYTVYNRIQENLTQSDRMIDMNGNIIGGVDNMFDDVRLNKELFELVTI